MDIMIATDGTIRAIYSDDLRELLEEGQTTIKRASHVEPCPGGWSADMSPVGGPVLGPYKTRAQALGREVAWLESHGIPVPE